MSNFASLKDHLGNVTSLKYHSSVEKGPVPLQILANLSENLELEFNNLPQVITLKPK